ncbi:MAG: hypothetical protein AAF743_03005 [Planctomycetota bacterium]
MCIARRVVLCWLVMLAGSVTAAHALPTQRDLTRQIADEYQRVLLVNVAEPNDGVRRLASDAAVMLAQHGRGPWENIDASITPDSVAVLLDEHADGLADPVARSYLRAYTKWARYDRQGAAIEIRPALALLEQGGDDDDDEVEPLLRFGVHKLAARIFGSGTHPASDAELAEKHESAAIDAAIDLLADTTVPPERERINLHETYIRHYQRDADASVARIVAALPDDETHWTQNLIAGEHLYSRSFRRSGNDDDGVRSQAYLRRAHALRPEWPEASVGLTLLTLRRDAAGVGDPRQWFESAIAAQLDYVEAWEQFSWTQRPRWGGSIEALVRLVEQGAATEAYDTAVPHEIARGIKHLLDETDNDVDPFRSDPRFAPLRPIVSKVYPPLIDALAQRGFDTSALEAEFVAALWLVGAWDEAAKRWPEAEGEDRRVAQALPMALRKFSGLVDDARFEIALAQRGRHADYRRIRDALIDNDPARLVEADDLLAELFDQIDDPTVQATVPRLAADVNLALKVHSEEWVEVPLDPAAWHVENGTLDVVDGGLVLIAGEADRTGAADGDSAHADAAAVRGGGDAARDGHVVAGVGLCGVRLGLLRRRGQPSTRSAARLRRGRRSEPVALREGSALPGDLQEQREGACVLRSRGHREDGPDRGEAASDDR